MEVKALQNIFTKILSSELNEVEVDSDVKEQITPDVISALYYLAKRHDLVHIVSYALNKYNLLRADEVKKKFNQEEILSVYRHVQMEYAYQQICGIFDKANIPYIPLKGAFIRPYYPREGMRTSCDIDILIKEEHLYQALDALEQNGYKSGEKTYHDVSLYSPNKIHLELHFNIQENIESLDCVLKDAWRYVVNVNNCHYEFTKEFFLFHMLAHMSYHFLSGGCGVRSLMDIWIIEHKMGITFEESKALLEKSGIYKFASEISKLANSCFSNEPMDDFSYDLLSYIIDGNLYGTAENSVAMGKKQTYTSPRYILKRVFISNKALSIEYPILKKCFLLYPFCWLNRTFKLSFRVAKRIFSRKKLHSTVAASKIENVQQLRSYLGI